MKTVLFIIAIAMLLVFCDNENETFNEIDLFNDGFYGGSFSYKDIDYWYSIEFNDNRYEEWPSGGAIYQKSFDCLTTGTYSIKDSMLTFTLDSFKFVDYPEPCVTEMILPGKYKINYQDNNDSIVFEKETANGKIIYKLKRADIKSRDIS
jgi:hypothetical protein